MKEIEDMTEQELNFELEGIQQHIKFFVYGKKELAYRDKLLKTLEKYKKYPKAEYESVMCCPECNFNKGVDNGNSGMPDRDEFSFENDDEGIEYVECPCGCKFIEE